MEEFMLSRNQAGQHLSIAAVGLDGLAMVGASISCFRKIDDQVEEPITGSIAESDLHNGLYTVTLSQEDTNGYDIAYFFTCTGMVPVCITVVTRSVEIPTGQPLRSPSARAIDLCDVTDVKAMLGINPVDGSVATVSASPISAGADQTVTPVVMVGITPGCILLVGTGTIREYILVKSVDAGGTFVANFNLAHDAPVLIVDQTDVMLSRLITANSVTIMRKIGRMSWDGSVPAQSTLVQQVDFDQWYDGNGNYRMMLRETPVASLSKVTVNGVDMPLSDNPLVAGVLIDSNRRSISIRSSSAGMARGYGSSIYSRSFSSWCFARGVQNVNVQYRAGFVSTPDDLVDACIEMVILNYQRRNWLDQATTAQPETIGAIRYRDWEFPPKVQAVIADWQRRWA